MTIDIATVLNGNVLSNKSCAFYVDGIPRKGIIAANYKESLEIEEVYDDSRSGAPIGSTYGRYKIDSFSLTLLRAAWNSTGIPPGLMQQLGVPNLGAFGNARFTFIAQYSEPLNPLATVVDTLAYCRVVGVEDDYSEDVKALVTKLDCRALFLVRNGTYTLNDPKRDLPI